MGNYVSCICSRPKPSVKILDLESNNLRHVEIPMNVAEIMLDVPGKFVSLAVEILKSHRITAMRADEELQAGKLYIVYPVRRMNSRASQEEMRVVTEVCSRKSGTRGGAAKVFPARVEDEKDMVKTLPKLTISSAEDDEGDTGFLGHRLNTQRQWKPELETIIEAKLE